MFAKAIFDQLLKRVEYDQLTVRYWDGEEKHYGKSGDTVGTLVIHDEKVLTDTSDGVDLAFAEAYMDGRLDFEGDIHDMVLFALRNRHIFPDLVGLKKITGALRGFTKSTTVKEQRQDIHHHYDLGNDFFRLFLDPSMTYSCAYYQSEKDTLEQAQTQKVEHTLRKLRLAKGEHLLDIGSGWGQMILRAARDSGVYAHGITMSDEQVAETEARIKIEHLTDLVTVALEDYRDHAKDHAEAYDKIVSVGMFEHVGRPNLARFMEDAATMLKPGGLMLLHFITKQKEEVGGSFTLKYIFPGGYIPSVRESVHLFAEHDFHLIDAENLGYHYALTLDDWARNFEANLDKVRALFSQDRFKERWTGEPDVERFIRMWRLYLRGAAAGFRSGTIQLHQFLVAKDSLENVPLTRQHLYQ